MPPLSTIRLFHFSLLVAAVIALAGVMAPQAATADNSAPITGWAWSSHMGWISFSGSGYGVSESRATGALSGYAWSSNFGWISFNVSDGTHPAPAVDVESGVGTISGWMRACAAFANKNACSGALDGNSGGWDGWIALAGTAADGSAYGVVQSPSCGWSGYAWGSDAIGAISMSGTAEDGSPYSVVGTDVAICSGIPLVSCSGAPGNPYVGQSVTWSSSVTGGSRNRAYSWSGTDGLSGTADSVSKTYATAGEKQATLTVTDTRSGRSGSAICTNDGGGTGITVISCTASLSANPDTVEQGENVALSWSVSGGSLCASSCIGSGFDTGDAISGSGVNASVPPTPPTTSYALTCSGGTYGPPPPANATVTVITPTADIKANNQDESARVNPATANNVSISWSSENSTSCAVTKNGAAWRTGLSSSGITDSVTVQTTYAIDCINSHGAHATDSVVVNILPSFQEF